MATGDLNKYGRGGPRRGGVVATRKGPPGPGFRGGTPTPSGYQPAHPRGGKPAGEPGDTRYDPSSAISDLLASIATDYDAALSDARGRYGGGGGGGGGGTDYSDAIKEAEDMLADVIGNRAALNEIYGDYGAVTDPEEEAAIAAAAAIVAENQPRFDQMAAQEQAHVVESYDEADATIAEMAALIGAEETARPVQQDVEGESVDLRGAVSEAAQAEALLNLQQGAATTGAQAAKSLDEGDFRRQTELVDMEFEQMEEDVQDRIKQLREAQAAAAAAAASRRRAAASSYASEIGLLEEERFQALQINPHEAGEATALSYLGKHGSGLDYNRQQLVYSTLSNALSQQVAPSQVDRWLAASEVSLRPEEKRLLSGAIGAYVTGMRYQQDRDRGHSATDSYTNREPAQPRGGAPTAPTRGQGPQ